MVCLLYFSHFLGNIFIWNGDTSVTPAYLCQKVLLNQQMELHTSTGVQCDPSLDPFCCIFYNPTFILPHFVLEGLGLLSYSSKSWRPHSALLKLTFNINQRKLGSRFWQCVAKKPKPTNLWTETKRTPTCSIGATASTFLALSFAKAKDKELVG